MNSKFLIIPFLAAVFAYSSLAADSSLTLSVQNSNPSVNSISSYSFYSSSSENVPLSEFVTCGSAQTRIFFQLNVSDLNGYEDIHSDGYAQYRIVLANSTSESLFSGFGSSLVNATFESGSGTNAVYNASFVMLSNYTNRTGPEVYRVIGAVNDGKNTTLSTSSQNKDFTFVAMPCESTSNIQAAINQSSIFSPANNTDLTLIFGLSQNRSGTIFVSRMNSSPVNDPAFTKTAVGDYYSIGVSKNISDSLSSAQIRISYSDAGVSGLDESSLRVYTFENSSWTMLESSGVDTSANYAYGNTTHFSIFAVFGDNASAQSGGGGGGGGVKKSPASLPLLQSEECSENWLCNSWSACEYGVQARECFDFNNCGTTNAEPSTESTCRPVMFPDSAEAGQPLFDIEVQIPENYRVIIPGQELLASIKLINVGSPGRVDVFLDYTIRNSAGIKVLQRKETVAVETQASFIRFFVIPEYLPGGEYTLEAKLTYFAGSHAVSHHSFKVLRKKQIIDRQMVVVGAVVMSIVLFVLLGRKAQAMVDRIAVRRKVREIVKNKMK